jgi:carbohydrate kinase (thermoresistant glucokinase family)
VAGEELTAPHVHPGSPGASGRHPLVVLMGVSGSGKSTVGPRLAGTLGVPFVDGDDLHTAAAKAQMAAGRPLDDADRAPWLDQLHDVLVAHTEQGIVLACSALKSSYREHLAGRLRDLIFLALVAPPTVLEHRLESRPGHFVGPALLPSQLETLELGDDIIQIDSTQPVAAVTAAAASAVRPDPR